MAGVLTSSEPYSFYHPSPAWTSNEFEIMSTLEFAHLLAVFLLVVACTLYDIAQITLMRIPFLLSSRPALIYLAASALIGTLAYFVLTHANVLTTDWLTATAFPFGYQLLVNSRVFSIRSGKKNELIEIGPGSLLQVLKTRVSEQILFEVAVQRMRITEQLVATRSSSELERELQFMRVWSNVLEPNKEKYVAEEIQKARTLPEQQRKLRLGSLFVEIAPEAYLKYVAANSPHA